MNLLSYFFFVFFFQFGLAHESRRSCVFLDAVRSQSDHVECMELCHLSLDVLHSVVQTFFGTTLKTINSYSCVILPWSVSRPGNCTHLVFWPEVIRGDSTTAAIQLF